MLKPTQIVTLAVLSALGPLALDMYLPGAVQMAEALGATSREATYTVSIFLFGIAAGQLFAGPLSDRFGRRPMVLFGLASFAVASILAAQTDSFAIMLIARLLQALGACAVLNSCRALVRDKLTNAAAARMFSQMSLVGGLAPVLGPMLGAWLVYIGSWRLIFYVMALIGVTFLVASFAFLPESRSSETAAQARSEHPSAAYRALIGHRTLRIYLLVAACNSAAFFSYIANSPSIFADVFALSPGDYSMLFALNSAALVGATQVNRLLLRRRTLDEALRISGRNALIVAGACLLLALIGSSSLAAFCAVLFFMVGSVAPVQANTIAGGLSVDGLRAGSAAALFGATTFASGAVGSWIGGVIYDGTERPLCLLLASCLIAMRLAIGRLGSHAVEHAS